MLSLRDFSSFVPFVVVALVGCGGSSGDSAASGTSNLTQVDQAGIDAQVLQIWTGGRLFPETSPGGWFSPTAKDPKIDPTSCPATGTFAGGTETAVDCADAFAHAAPFDVDGKSGPVFTPVSFTIYQSPAGGTKYIDPDYCRYVELRVVVRDAASSAPTFAGVGFWTSHGETFAKKGDLQAVGHTRLKNGDNATVYRFSGISTCISSAHNSTSGNEFQTFAFKPYAAYDVDGTRYRVWESIQGNFNLGRSWPGATPVINSDGFDRQGDLL
jgi:hypothetical protein